MARAQRFTGGPLLRQAREQAGEEREELALDVGRTAQTVELWEAGFARPPRHILVRLSQRYGIDLLAHDRVPV